jgi:Uma2 family endonuclease
MEGGDEMKPTTATRLTYDDFLSFPDDGQRHELIDGEHYVTPSPNIPHQRLLGRLYAALHQYFLTSPCGEAFFAPLDVVLSDHDIVEPDLLVVLNDQSDIVTKLHVRGAPAILVEVLSPSTRRRDQTLKHRLYDRVGVREYWLVDPDRDAVTVCRRTDAHELAPAAELSAASGDSLVSPLLPGFSLLIRELFAPR